MVDGFLFLAGLALPGPVFFSRHGVASSGPELHSWRQLLPALAPQPLWQRLLSTTQLGLHSTGTTGGGFLMVFGVVGFDLAPMARSIRRLGRAS